MAVFLCCIITRARIGVEIICSSLAFLVDMTEIG